MLFTKLKRKCPLKYWQTRLKLTKFVSNCLANDGRIIVHSVLHQLFWNQTKYEYGGSLFSSLDDIHNVLVVDRDTLSGCVELFLEVLHNTYYERRATYSKLIRWTYGEWQSVVLLLTKTRSRYESNCSWRDCIIMPLVQTVSMKLCGVAVWFRFCTKLFNTAQHYLSALIHWINSQFTSQPASSAATDHLSFSTGILHVCICVNRKSALLAVCVVVTLCIVWESLDVQLEILTTYHVTYNRLWT